ncbi:hypothetical protein H0H81_009561 [Sphagnurus paluster]|uniref:Uncharacterized protein n=1 Tax=Sphagnurus paluster TaxID=117069 RepID=A0A9P7K1N5_9AGAR|nr:hypothetical protein H0H81_009561 [Sphagnurus paluster]
MAATGVPNLAELTNENVNQKLKECQGLLQQFRKANKKNKAKLGGDVYKHALEDYLKQAQAFQMRGKTQAAQN